MACHFVSNLPTCATPGTLLTEELSTETAEVLAVHLIINFHMEAC